MIAFQDGGGVMWSLTSDDVQRAKEHARQRRAEVEARYAEELKSIEAECAEIDTLERIAAEFSQRHNRPAPPAAELSEFAPNDAVLPAPAAEPAADGPIEEPPANGGDRKLASRWRFQLAHRGEDGAAYGEP
jgi:hypothetical protein